MQRRNKICDWEAKRDDLNEKLDNCQDKLGRARGGEKLQESKAKEHRLLAAKVRDVHMA